MNKSRPTVKDRFLEKIIIGDGCWNWTAATTRGYGCLRVNGRALYAHRLAYELYRGPIPAGDWVLHRCHNPRCVRPDHLMLGDAKTNSRQAAALGRMGKYDRRGERNPAAKLNISDVHAIRAALARGEKEAHLAQRYGVTRTAIHWIKTDKNWASV